MDSSLRCPVEGCNAYYNLKDRLPISLLCCGNTACKKCVHDMILSENKEEKVKKEGFRCAFNQCNQYAPPDVDAPMPLCVDAGLKK